MKFVFIFFSLLILFSCSDLPGNEKVLLNKKWYNGSEISIEFKEDFRYLIHFSNDSIREHRFEFLESNSLRIIDSKNNANIFDYFYDVKDSILLMVYADDSLRKGDSFDSTFFHLNPKYSDWQSRELYYYGKIISEKDPRVLPFIYYEF